ncbi:thermonuclease family protein [Methyloceanibacter sp.]|uniref:thermonuclease family protein n=1 Tax=Methyloceanibacter sp. TaxID=1965321 RepID=UPI002C4FB6AF|nr:thermonuclease family protein [Methyloceanibacter sp.]HML93093.1 thermonuclease family protein [Methyloceanibacter sp.]
MRLFVAAILAGLAMGSPRSLALPHGCDLPPGETVAIADAIDGETVRLEDGRAVRLLGVQAPAAPRDWDGPEPWPFAVLAEEALAKIATGSTAELRFDARKEDRHGHVLAQVYVEHDGSLVWLQAKLVEEGLARVAALPDLGACLAPLVAAEREARDGRRGLWRSLTYQVRDANNPKALGYLRHSYQLVEGTVHGVGEGKTLVYINFVEDWRSDFTVAIPRKRLPALEAAGLDLAALPGKRIRVRGWVEWWNGPMIRISHPEEIEVLGASPGAG